VQFEAFRLDSEFEAKRRELLSAKRGERQTPSPLKISDREMHEVVCEFFVNLEKLSEEWGEQDVPKMNGLAKRDLLADLREDASASDGIDTGPFVQDDGSRDLENFLKAKGWTISKDSPEHKKLCSLFRRARHENTLRNIDRLLNRTVTPQETIFQGVFAHTPVKPARPVVTLGEMLKRFAKTLIDTKRTEGTQRTYEIPCRILREFFGENTSLDAITSEEIERLFDLLRRLPANAAQRYPLATRQPNENPHEGRLLTRTRQRTRTPKR
jgi:hypothetical protein